MRLKEFTKVPSTSAANASVLIVWAIVTFSYNTNRSKYRLRVIHTLQHGLHSESPIVSG